MKMPRLNKKERTEKKRFWKKYTEFSVLLENGCTFGDLRTSILTRSELPVYREFVWSHDEGWDENYPKSEIDKLESTVYRAYPACPDFEFYVTSAYTGVTEDDNEFELKHCKFGNIVGRENFKTETELISRINEMLSAGWKVNNFEDKEVK